MRAAPIPVVFLPALLCDAQQFQALIADLGDAVDARVLLSPLPSLQDSAADILARAPERFVLVGSSYGGSLALEVALAAPDRVSALCLMGCNPAGPQAGGPDLAAGLETTPDAVVAMLAGLVVPKTATAAAAAFVAMAGRVGATAGAAQARAMAGRSAVASRLAALTMPALALWGEDDPLAPVAVGLALAAGLPRGRLEVLRGCGHLPALEQPAQVAAKLRQLLALVAPQT